MRKNGVRFDGKSLIIDGRRQWLISGAVHYPRSTPEMWPGILKECRKAGLNCVETYVFWEAHEPQEGQFDFSGRLDLERFLKLAQAEGLQVILRIGPYICGEWNFGGLPWWLTQKPGLVTRTMNRPFLEAVERWMRLFSARFTPYQHSQGGPVILIQMENEYNNVAKRYGAAGQRYLAWSAELARRCGWDAPQIMCLGASPDVIETLNGYSVLKEAAELRHRRPWQPLIWTECWTSWYDTWTQPAHHRALGPLAADILDFAAQGGSGVNYYMFHGGSNFGRDAMYLQATSYAFDAPLDEYGRATPKSRALARLHAFLRKHQQLLLLGRRRSLDASRTEVGHRGRTLCFVKEPRGTEVISQGRRLLASWALERPQPQRASQPLPWKPRWNMLEEPFPGESWDAVRKFEAVRLPHNMLADTKDRTDFGWYSLDFSSPRSAKATLSFHAADRVSLWLNDRFVGALPSQPREFRERPADFEHNLELNLKPGRNRLRLLVQSLGLIKGDWMLGRPQSEEWKGLAQLRLGARKVARLDFSPGLAGEAVGLERPATAAALRGWRRPAGRSRLRWYRSLFQLSATELADPKPWAFDPGDLALGRLWINGHDAGRYWQAPPQPEFQPQDSWLAAHLEPPQPGPVQTHYHVPASWLKPGWNELLVLEQEGRLPGAAGFVRKPG